MKLLTTALLAAALPLTAQTIPNFPAADLVLGQTNFVSNNSETSAAGLSTPTGIAIDPKTGKLFVSDRSAERILRFPNAAALVNGQNAEAVFGQVNFSESTSGTTQRKFNSANGLHVDARGRLWVADTLNSRVLMFDAASSRGSTAFADLVLGQVDFDSNGAGDGANQMAFPTDVIVDGDADRLWVVELSNNRVLRFEQVSSANNGAFANGVLGQAGFGASAAGLSRTEMDEPVSLALAPDGTLFVVSQNNNRVLRFDNAAAKPNGAPADGVLGQPDFVSAPAASSATGFNNPTGIGLDTQGTLWVVDTINSRVVSFANAASLPNGASATGILGQPNFTDNAASPPSTQRIVDPLIGIAFDTANRLYLSDSANSRVLRFSPVAAPSPAPTPAVVDTAAPKIKVKGRRSIDSLRNRVVFRGTASDNTDVAGIEFKVSGQGGFQVARGTTSWKAVVRPDKKKRKTVVRVRAIDAAGNKSRFLKIKIFRR